MGASQRRIVGQQVQRHNVHHHVQLNVVVVTVTALGSVAVIDVPEDQHTVGIDMRKLTGKETAHGWV